MTAPAATLPAPDPRRRTSDASGSSPGRPSLLPESRNQASPAADRTDLRNKVFRRALAAADGAAVLLALALSVQVLGNDRIRLSALAGIPLVLVLSKLIGLYDRDELLLHKSTADEVPKLFTLATVYALIVDVMSPVFSNGNLARGQLVALWLVLFLAVGLCRTLARATVRGRTAEERCIVVGDPADCERLAHRLENHNSINAAAVSKLPLKPRRGGEDRWTLDAVASVVSYNQAERMVIAPWTKGHEEILDLVRIAKGVGVHVSVLPGVFEVIGSHVEFDEIDGMTVLGVRRFELTRSARAIKRGMDIVAASVAILLFAPLFAAIAFAVRWETLGPVFFRQERVGRDGKRFCIWKFRTMVVDAEALKAGLRDQNETEGLFKMAADPRVTKVGRFLRKTSLDELPQLFNVLMGSMSLVGPRPLVVDEDELVKGWDRRRLHLTPGMTGPWQVLGGGRIPLAEMVKIDYLYVTGWSLWNDTKIMLRTIAYVIARRSV